MIRIAICDDSQGFLQQTKFMLDHWDERPHAFTTELFSDGDSLLKSHAADPFDIILLDIIMPLINGIEIAREIREKDKNVRIVFLTSSVEFAVESYSVKASNYLVKPLIPDSFFSCMSELMDDMSEKDSYISIRCSDGVHRVKSSSIEFVEAQNKNIIFTMNDGHTIRSNQPLYSYEESLTEKDGFFKCHRSYIINLFYIDTFNTKEVTMRSGCIVPISRKYHKEFEEAYFTAYFGKAGGIR